VIRPVVQRIAPKLACGTERIRRTACYCNGRIIIIELEQIRVCPCICTVKCSVDRNISYDFNPLPVCIPFEVLPLNRKFELLETAEIDVFLILVPVRDSVRVDFWLMLAQLYFSMLSLKKMSW
jgi:hypothetical protein